MANSINSYSDTLIMKCLLTRNFLEIGRVFEDNVITKVKPAAFYQAQNLDRITLSALKDVGDYAFAECGASTIELPWTLLETIREGAFYNCQNEGLPAVVSMPAMTAVGAQAFAGSSGKPNTWLQSISLAAWTGTTPTATGLSIGTATGPFENCTALTSVSLPELTQGSSRMFYGATGIQKIKLPKCSRLSANTFSACSTLKKVELGGAFTSLSNMQFMNAYALEAVIFSGLTSVPTLSSNVFNSSPVASGNAYIYVPRSLEATIKLATNWSTYASQIRAIEDYPDIVS